MRGFAQELGESTNSVRLELCKLHEAGLIIAKQDGQKVLYSPNIQNPFYLELCSIVSKHLGFDLLITRVFEQLGNLVAAYVVGDYANGVDSGTIEVVLVGEIKSEYLKQITRRCEEEMNRKLKIHVLENEASFFCLKFENVLKLFGK